MRSAALDIRQMLADAGLGTIGTDLFVDQEPSTPHACITCYDSGGEGPEPTVDLYHPTVMVKVRGNPRDFNGTYAKAMNVLTTLHGKNEVTVGGSRYLLVLATGDIMTMPRDELDRPSFTINFRMMRTPSS